MRRMKPVFAALGTAAVVGMVAVTPAEAAHCRTVSCLQKQVNSLSSKLKKDTKLLSALTTCLGEVPVTRYGDGNAGTYGYVYSPGSDQASFNTTALDGTTGANPVSVWLMFDSCNKQKTASARDQPSIRPHVESGVFGPIAPEYSVWQSFPLGR